MVRLEVTRLAVLSMLTLLEGRMARQGAPPPPLRASRAQIESLPLTDRFAAQRLNDDRSEISHMLEWSNTFGMDIALKLHEEIFEPGMTEEMICAAMGSPTTKVPVGLPDRHRTLWEYERWWHHDCFVFEHGALVAWWRNHGQGDPAPAMPFAPSGGQA